VDGSDPCISTVSHLLCKPYVKEFSSAARAVKYHIGNNCLPLPNLSKVSRKIAIPNTKKTPGWTHGPDTISWPASPIKSSIHLPIVNTELKYFLSWLQIHRNQGYKRKCCVFSHSILLLTPFTMFQCSLPTVKLCQSLFVVYKKKSHFL